MLREREGVKEEGMRGVGRREADLREVRRSVDAILVIERLILEQLKDVVRSYDWELCLSGARCGFVPECFLRNHWWKIWRHRLETRFWLGWTVDGIALGALGYHEWTGNPSSASIMYFVITEFIVS